MNLNSLLKMIILHCCRIISNAMNIVPIKEDRLLFYSYNGKSYSCNPRVITEYLIEHKENCEIIWAFKDVKKNKQELPKEIIAVRYRSPKYYYYFKTSKIIISNVQGYGEVARRNEQLFIQTWHASNGYKKVSDFTGLRRKLSLLGHRDYTHVMCGSASMELRRVQGSMGFVGPIIKGTPRMDAMINGNITGTRNKIGDIFNIPTDNKIILYAPTWRRNKNDDFSKLDFERLSKIFNNKCTILIRLHPNIKNKVSERYSYVKDVTGYGNMQELLCASDILISDYSSCIWDYSFLYRPCYLFCYDYDDYYSDKKFEIPISDWRFPICKNMDELEKSLLETDYEVVKKNMIQHHMEMGSYEDGHATERVVALIKDNIKCNP